MMSVEQRIKIKSYVIFDTETTGLPTPGNNPRITELCLLALTREELQSKQGEPRVFNKLHLCLDPCRPIHPRSSDITGLYNDSLSCQASFKTQSDLIVSFLQNLPQPACLVAHNGHRFDFPLLKAELKKSRKTLSDSILCADTLEAFRIFDGLPPVPDYVLQKEKERRSHLTVKCHELITPPLLGVHRPSAQVDNPQHDEKVEEIHKDQPQKNNSCGGRKRTFEVIQEYDDEKRKSFKEHESPLLKSNEVTPDRKPPNPSLDDLKTPEESSRPKQGEADHVRKRLFSTPRLSLKSNKDTTEVPLKRQERSVSDNCNESVDHDSKSSTCHPEKDWEAVCGSSISRQLSITDSDSYLLEACEEAERSLSEAGKQNECKDEEEEMENAEIELQKTKVKLTEIQSNKTAEHDTLKHEANKSNVSPNTVKGRESNGTPKSYSLGKLYLHYFGQLPDVLHTAEDDCKVLMKIMILKLAKILPYCDENAKLFSDVEPMY